MSRPVRLEGCSDERRQCRGSFLFEIESIGDGSVQVITLTCLAESKGLHERDWTIEEAGCALEEAPVAAITRALRELEAGQRW